MDKNDSIDFFQLFSHCYDALQTRWSWSIGDDVEQKTVRGVRLPGRGISEDDQREIQAANRVGP